MLRELRIRNYALIERLDLELPGGLVAFTGETGAGKSIVIGALALAVGGKAQQEQLRSGADAIVVEALFDMPPEGKTGGLLEEAGIAGDGDLLLRRVVSASGRSRAYVNDATVTVTTLERLGRELVDIHGQHQHQSLLRSETHLDYLDGFGGLLERRSRFAELHRRWAELLQERERLAAREGEKSRRQDFLAFQRQEIEKAGLRAGEEEELAARREVLRNAERLAEAAGEAVRLLYSGESPAAELVHRAARRLGELAAIDPSLGQLARSLEECQLQLEEIGREVQSYHRGLGSDPGELEEMEERLAQIRGLKKKYGATVPQVLARLEEIVAEEQALETSAERLAAIERDLPGVEKGLRDEAAALSELRRRCRRDMEGRILAELEQLNLKGSLFEVALERERDDAGGIEVEGVRLRVDERGIDRAEFLVSANPGEPPKPLARIASGGELSRIMLALKTVLSGVDRIPTLVFDEVDIGIGGKTARMVGDRLLKVASGRQVLCVTHLPQIASVSDSHYNIAKSVRKGRTTVTVRPLEGQERVGEIARMLGGGTVTETTRRHASEMLDHRA